MNIIKALEKTIELWERRLKSDKIVKGECRLCGLTASPFYSKYCSGCPAQGEFMGFKCNAFIRDYCEPLHRPLSDKETKDLICEQAIGYADMLLQEEYKKEIK